MPATCTDREAMSRPSKASFCCARADTGRQFSEWNCKLQLQSLALRTILRGYLVQPLQCKSAFRELIANLWPHGNYSAAVPVQILTAVHLVIGELVEPIADDAELNRVQ